MAVLAAKYHDDNHIDAATVTVCLDRGIQIIVVGIEKLERYVWIGRKRSKMEGKEADGNRIGVHRPIATDGGSAHPPIHYYIGLSHSQWPLWLVESEAPHSAPVICCRVKITLPNTKYGPRSSSTSRGTPGSQPRENKMRHVMYIQETSVQLTTTPASDRSSNFKN